MNIRFIGGIMQLCLTRRYCKGWVSGMWMRVGIFCWSCLGCGEGKLGLMSRGGWVA
jgi:hypothetical protein